MTETKPPRVTVLMSVHNTESYVAASVESILGQTFKDFEFIIIDDGSTDSSFDICKGYASIDTRVVLHQRPSQGLTSSLNYGLTKARGELIARMDADDISLPYRLDQQVSEFLSTPSLVLLGSEVELISSEGAHLGPRRHPREHHQIRAQLLRGNGGAMTHPAVMFLRQSALEVGGYDESFKVGQDLDFFLRLTERGCARNLQSTLLLWRQHPSSINRTQSTSWASLKANAIEKTIHRIGPTKFSEELFAAEETFRFPDTAIGLGRIALRNNRSRTAMTLFLRALREGPCRFMAVMLILKAALQHVKHCLNKAATTTN